MSAYIITYYSESTSDTCIRRRTLPAEVVREGRRGRSGHMHSRNGDVHSPSDRSQSRIYLQTQVPAHWEAADGVGKLQGKVESHGCFTWFNIPQQSDMQATELTGTTLGIYARPQPASTAGKQAPGWLPNHTCWTTASTSPICRNESCRRFRTLKRFSPESRVGG
ncbi:hypothetical protein M8818_005677 [Zalaria obscura]|uniref:Uncharacterized protein n=1 Tax=Zalaria obscura TaxID=2024903 RepID=A0ACC3S987_9PEZI